MFEIDVRLDADSIPLVETDDVVVRMINDARYPWVLLVPRVHGAAELHDLSESQFGSIMALARSIGSDMAQIFRSDKINTAAIGNIVRQLHVHVVARYQTDDAWPGPVWGVGEAKPLSDTERESRTQALVNSPTLRRLLESST